MRRTTDPDSSDPELDAAVRAFVAEEGIDAAHSALQRMSRTPLHEVPVPETIGPYKIARRLGHGGMGIVYLAEQSEPIGRLVAVKVVGPGMSSETILRRFDLERRSLGRMHHPGIAQIFDSGLTADGSPYFVMEYIDGAPLLAWCDAERASIELRIRLFLQLCAAVEHAHHKGVIHRDLKASNVLVHRVDGKPRIKVIDFGLAKAMHEPLADEAPLTRVDAVLGTIDAMSPEQAEGSDVDIRSDIYSLGVLLHQLLVGIHPYERELGSRTSREHLRTMFRARDPDAPSRAFSRLMEARQEIAERRSSSVVVLQKLVEDDLDWVVLKALERDRDRRYRSVDTFREDIERFLRREPVSAGPPTVRYRLRKFISRNRTATAVAVSILACVGVATFFSTRFYIREQIAMRTANQHESVARDLSGFVGSLLTTGLRGGTRGAAATQRDMFLAASRDIENRFRDAPLVRGMVYGELGRVLFFEGENEVAAHCFEEAVSSFTAASASELTFSKLRVSFASLEIARGRWTEARALLEPAIRGFESSALDEPLTLSHAKAMLADVAFHLGDRDLALRIADEIGAVLESQLTDDGTLTRLQVDLIELWTELGRIDEANRALEEIERAETSVALPARMRAIVHRARGRLELVRGDGAAALREFTVAEEIAARAFGVEHQLTQSIGAERSSLEPTPQVSEVVR